MLTPILRISLPLFHRAGGCTCWGMGLGVSTGHAHSAPQGYSLLSCLASLRDTWVYDRSCATAACSFFFLQRQYPLLTFTVGNLPYCLKILTHRSNQMTDAATRHSGNKEQSFITLIKHPAFCSWSHYLWPGTFSENIHYFGNHLLLHSVVDSSAEYCHQFDFFLFNVLQ